MARGETYEEFVEKFKTSNKPKTTDDCYTPMPVYETVKNWVGNEYENLGGGVEISRPFYPGGDYQNEDYTNKVVIDNPPFSILSEIIHFYLDNNIKFFLFAPHLTLFNYAKKVNYIVINLTITYENGAKVNTSFITNLGDKFIRTAPELKAELKKVNKCGNTRENTRSYPFNVISSALLSKITDKQFEIEKNQASFTRVLDEQKKVKKSIFGAGFYISDNKAKEFEKLSSTGLKYDEVWNLSEREKEIIMNLKS